MTFLFVQMGCQFLIGAQFKINDTIGAWGRPITGVDIFICINLLMLMGNGPTMILSVCGPKIAKAKDAATILFHIIEQKPAVDVTAGGEKVTELKGDFIFKGVNFNYPTRPDLKIL